MKTFKISLLLAFITPFLWSEEENISFSGGKLKMILKEGKISLQSTGSTFRKRNGRGPNGKGISVKLNDQIRFYGDPTVLVLRIHKKNYTYKQSHPSHILVNSLVIKILEIEKNEDINGKVFWSFGSFFVYLLLVLLVLYFKKHSLMKGFFVYFPVLGFLTAIPILVVVLNITTLPLSQHIFFSNILLLLVVLFILIFYHSKEGDPMDGFAKPVKKTLTLTLEEQQIIFDAPIPAELKEKIIENLR